MILEGSVRLPFRYAAGTTASTFLEALRDEGRLLGSRCPACGTVLCPPRLDCRCGERATELVEVGPAGTLVSWTELPGRGAYGLVRPDGADTAFVHRLLDAPESLRGGMRVHARFAEERSGGIADLAGFEVAS
ncbi:MAG: zinc ribbon domain-containing protein [Gaiella sp.]|nr:zinc ribbon domain-containing protein [Gaiella sp.]